MWLGGLGFRGPNALINPFAPPSLTWGAMLVSGNRELSCARNSLLATQGTSSDAGASNEEA